MTDIVYRVVFYTLILKLLMTLYQRKFNETGGLKRMVSLYHCLIIGALYGILSGIRVKSLPDFYIYIAIVVCLVVFGLFRKKLFPYMLNCSECGKRLKISQILFIDSQLCNQCNLKD